MQDTYPEVKVPARINQDNFSMSKKDVQGYFEWFMTVRSERLRLFCQQVFVSSGIEFSPEKLQAIYYFFKDRIKVRKRTQEDIELERAKLPNALQKIHQVPDYDFIEPTQSIIFDASIYFGELLRKEVSGVEWSIEKDKKMVNFGKPILIKNGMNIDVNPAGVFYLMTIKIQQGFVQEDILLDAYQKAKDKFEGKQKDFLAMVNSWGKKK
jgi:hypothetical protein